MTLEDLSQATAAMQAAADAFNSKAGEIDDAAQAATNNLLGLTESQAWYQAKVDANDPAPTRVSGGTFLSIKEVTDRAPAGSLVRIELLPDQTYTVAYNINLKNRFLRFVRPKYLPGANPVLIFETYTFVQDATELNANYGFSAGGGGSLSFDDISIQLKDKANPAADWSLWSNLLHYQTGATNRVRLGSCVVTGVAGQSITSCGGGGVALLGLYNTVLDGPIYAVAHATNGSVVIGKNRMTLMNGASLTDAGTIGVNILSN